MILTLKLCTKMKKIQTFQIALFFSMLMIFSQNGNAQKIWFTIVAQPNDASIGQSVKKDVDNMVSFMNAVARNCNMQMEYKYFDRSAYTQAGDYLQNLSVGSDDVVFYYYSGHGKNEESDDFPTYEDMALSGVHSMLKQKGARLTITMYDCCNYIPNRSLSSSRTLDPALVHLLMFKKSKGDIKVSAASKGNYAVGSSEIGGFFTKSFLEALPTVSNPANVWQTVLETARTETNKKCTMTGGTAQNPVFEINVVTSGGSNGNSIPTQVAPDDKSKKSRFKKN